MRHSAMIAISGPLRVTARRAAPQGVLRARLEQSMNYWIVAWAMVLVPVLVRADTPRPATGGRPTVVATWKHQVTGPDRKVTTGTTKLYSNGRNNDPKGKDTWTRTGNTLTLRWSDPKAPGGAWVDSCRVSADGKTYMGKNQIGGIISGKLVGALAAPAPALARRDRARAASALLPPPPPLPPQIIAERERAGAASVPDSGPEPAIPSRRPPLLPPRPVVPPLLGKSLKGEARKVGGVTVTTLKLDASAVERCLFWDGPKGEALYALYRENGVIRRLSYPDFTVLREANVPQNSNWLAPSAEGLVLSPPPGPGLPVILRLRHPPPNPSGVWLLDPDSLEVKARLGTSNASHAASAPGLSVAVGAGDSESGLVAIDLKSGATTVYAPIQFTSRYSKENRDEPLPVRPFMEPSFTPDGAHLFTHGANSQICRFHIDGGKVKLDEVSAPVSIGLDQPRAPQVSPDSKRLCVTVRAVQVFTTDSLARPIRKLDLDDASAVGFDPVDGRIYVLRTTPWLVVFGPDGVKKTEYAILKPPHETWDIRQCLVHPGGAALILLASPESYLVELPRTP